MCCVLRFHCFSTEEINKSFQVKGLFPVNVAFADRLKTTHASIRIKYDFKTLDKADSSKVSTKQGGRIRPSDKATTEGTRILAWKIMKHSHLIQRLFILAKKQKTAYTILRFRLARVRSNLLSVLCLRSAERFKRTHFLKIWSRSRILAGTRELRRNRRNERRSPLGLETEVIY